VIVERLHDAEGGGGLALRASRKSDAVEKMGSGEVTHPKTVRICVGKIGGGGSCLYVRTVGAHDCQDIEFCSSLQRLRHSLNV
jgi:hypothetical protein